jgi:histidinol-phosphatase (PHP family)
MPEAAPNLPPDYHTHNLLCKHADGRPADYARAARDLGLAELAATDHCPTDDQFGIEHRMRLDQFDAYSESVRAAQRVEGVSVLFGIEADYYDGCERFLAPWIERHGFDVALGSVHFIDYWSGQGLSNGRDSVALWREYFLRIGRMADTGLFDIAAHLDLPKKFGNEVPDTVLRELALPALDRLAEARMAIEINTSGMHHLPRAFYPSAPLLLWAAERGIGLTFGSDAHHPRRVAEGFAEAVTMARMAGFKTYRRYRGRAWRDVPLA